MCIRDRLVQNAGGAAARPFETHFNALNEDLKLRISLELYLKLSLIHISKDNVTMQIDTVVFFQITDPKLFAYGVENPIMAIENLDVYKRQPWKSWAF